MMPREIHVILKDGKPVYREWSTVVDAYTTTPTANLEAFKQLLWEYELEETKRRFEEEFPQRIERALASGTSSRLPDRKRKEEMLNGRWKRRRRS